MTFRPGQRIVCVDASGAPELRLGAVYSVMALCKCHKPAGVRLDGTEPEGRYCSFEGERFRLKTETGMAILHQILANERAPA